MVFGPSISDIVLGVGGLVGVTGAVAYVRAVTKAEALRAWRDTAEGYKEQNAELTSRLQLAEERLLLAEKKISDLEKRPDMTELMELVASQGVKSLTAVESFVHRDGEKTRAAVRDLRSAVGDVRQNE